MPSFTSKMKNGFRIWSSIIVIYYSLDLTFTLVINKTKIFLIFR